MSLAGPKSTVICSEGETSASRSAQVLVEQQGVAKVSGVRVVRHHLMHTLDRQQLDPGFLIARLVTAARKPYGWKELRKLSAELLDLLLLPAFRIVKADGCPS